VSEQTSLVDGAWSNIQALIDNGGNITIGEVRPIRCVAVAADEDNMVAALRRRDGESFTQLLDRLDEAIDKAFEQDIYTDEINR
jgi:hypothetical protein